MFFFPHENLQHFRRQKIAYGQMRSLSIRSQTWGNSCDGFVTSATYVTSYLDAGYVTRDDIFVCVYIEKKVDP